MEIPQNKIIFSGIQPSGTLHIGNYLGAIKQWVELQNNNTAFFCIVDLHAITVPYEKEELATKTLDAAAMYLATGVNPEKSTIFVQSHVPAHTELAWLLNTITPLGELKRMTQFKDKEEKQQGESSLGLFAYPVLMASDILLYNTEVVPVGEDQIQHIELARSVAKKFNNIFAEKFTIPKPFLNKNTMRIMSLTDPTRKMSKSDGEKTYIALTDDADTIKKKIMSAMTETEFNILSDTPSMKNLRNIYQVFSEESPENIEKTFEGKGHKEFKEGLAKVVITRLSPIREKYEEIREDEDTLKQILAQGKEKAEEVANKKLAEVKEVMGFVQ